MAIEGGIRNAECGKYENQTFSRRLFRIPHSNFRIPRCLTPKILTTTKINFKATSVDARKSYRQTH
jgi:hypothetical protein